MKSLKLICTAFAMASLLVACGDDDSSSRVDDENYSSQDEGSSSNSKGSGSSSSGDSRADTTKYISGEVNKADTVDLSKYLGDKFIIDDRNDKQYGIVRTDLNIWMTENLDYKQTGLWSTCYDYDSTNCTKYGRLYQSGNNSDYCPQGYKLPTISEWKQLLNSDEKFEPVYGGYCIKRDTLVCSGKADTAAYLASDGIFKFTKSDYSSSGSSYSGGYYSVRCIRRMSIVDNKKSLPSCTSNSPSYGYIYAVEEDSVYNCSSYYEEWSSYRGSYSVYCDSNERYVYKSKDKETGDVLYICKNSSWEPATIYDLDESCNKKLIHKEQIFNNERYSCSDTGWVKLKYPANELGECYEKNYGKAAKTSAGLSYRCDSTDTWKKLTIEEAFGKCSGYLLKDSPEVKRGEIVTFDTLRYMCTNCQTSYCWQAETEHPVDELGFCTPDLKDSVYIVGDRVYKCTHLLLWGTVDNWDYLGACEKKDFGKITAIGSQKYLCNDYSQLWQTVSTLYIEEDTVICQPDLYGKIYEKGYSTYICKIYDEMYQFESATNLEISRGICPIDTSYTVTEGDSTYTCNNQYWTVAKADPEKIFGSCYSSTATRDTVYNGKHYYCDHTTNYKYWQTYNTQDSLAGDYCSREISGKTFATDNGDMYVCDSVNQSSTNYRYHWHTTTIDVIMGECTKAKEGDSTFNGINYSVCKSGAWVPAGYDSVTDERDGRTYKTVTIGNLTILAENLKYIPEGEEFYTDSSSTPATELPEGDGVYMPWHVAMKLDAERDSTFNKKTANALVQGLCMDGWRLPTLAEMETMIEKFTKLYPTSVLNNIYGGSDFFGLNLTTGYHNPEYNATKNVAYLWTADEYTAAKSKVIVFKTSGDSYAYALKTNAYPVRCVKEN